jgi:hypothetical protein
MKQSIFKILSIFVGLLIVYLFLLLTGEILKICAPSYYGKFELSSTKYTQQNINMDKKNYLTKAYLAKKNGFDKNYLNYDMINSQQKILQDTQITSHLMHDKKYWIFQPSNSFTSTRMTKSKILVYKEIYTTDQHSRRITQFSSNINYTEQILFLGDSFTFGLGVGDNDNFPYVYSNLNPDTRTYNLGIPGGGPNDSLDDLINDTHRFSDIKKIKGYTLFTAIDDHIERVSCTAKCFNNRYKDWIEKKTNYEYDETTNHLIDKGSFTTSRPIQNIFYRLFSSIYLFEFLNINYPPYVTDSQILKFVQIINEIKKITTDKFHTKFIFTFYPDNFTLWPRVKPYLEKYNIHYFDFSDVNFYDIMQERGNIALEGHPSKASHYLFAKLLEKELQVLDEKK